VPEVIQNLLKSLTPEKTFLFFGIVWGIINVFLTPPFQVQDEPAHFFRAFQISEGKLFPKSYSISLGEYLPLSLNKFEDVWAKVVVEKKGKTSFSDFRDAMKIPLKVHQTKFFSFHNTALYSPVTHLPQASGIFIGRFMGLPVLVIFYLGRIFNGAKHHLPVFSNCAFRLERHWISNR